MKKNYLIIGGVALMMAATTACKKDEPTPDNPGSEDPVVGNDLLTPVNFSSPAPMA